MFVGKCNYTLFQNCVLLVIIIKTVLNSCIQKYIVYIVICDFGLLQYFKSFRWYLNFFNNTEYTYNNSDPYIFLCYLFSKLFMVVMLNGIRPLGFNQTICISYIFCLMFVLDKCIFRNKIKYTLFSYNIDKMMIANIDQHFQLGFYNY